MQTEQNEFGYFGKLPTFGDFIHQLLPQDFANGFHEWLQQSMASARTALGDDFLTWYLNCPAWKFLVTPGVCGEQSITGLTIPSVDRVGRYFNFTLATVLPTGVNPASYVTSNPRGFQALETAALDILEADFAREELEVKVREVVRHFDSVPQAHCESEVNVDFSILSQEHAQSFSGHAAALLDCMLSRQMGDYSIWWTGREGQNRSRMLVCSGMPSAEAYLQLLTQGEAAAAPEDESYIDQIIAGET